MATCVKSIAQELRDQICRVAALTAAVTTSLSIVDASTLERVRALASVAEEYADESLALTDRCISHLLLDK